MIVSASSASRSDLATTVGPIARACGANASGGRRLATATLMTGEGPGESLAYRTESYNRIAHSTSPIRVDIDSPAFNGAGLSVSLHGDLREIFGPPPQAMRVFGSNS